MDQKGKKESNKAALKTKVVLLGLLLSVSLSGCVKRVYVTPDEEISFKQLYLDCVDNKGSCQEDLDRTVELLNDLLIAD